MKEHTQLVEVIGSCSQTMETKLCKNKNIETLRNTDINFQTLIHFAAKNKEERSFGWVTFTATPLVLLFK